MFFTDFSNGINSDWAISSWKAPGEQSIFNKENVFIKDGVLCIKLSQTKNDDESFTSIGGEISTVQKFGFGTYEFIMRTSSTASSPYESGISVSGSVTGAFNYLDNPFPASTEIDIEIEGARPFTIQLSSWINEKDINEISSVNVKQPSYLEFHIFKFIWTTKNIKYYKDGKLIGVHHDVIPELPAKFFFNHWGTNDVHFGGIGTTGIDRFVFIKSFLFIPQK